MTSRSDSRTLQARINSATHPGSTAQDHHSKKELRQHFRKLLLNEGDNAAVFTERVATLNARLTDVLRRQTGSWAAYQATGFEPDLRALIHACPHIDWIFPRVEGETLGFYRVPPDRSVDAVLFTLNTLGILEPDPATSERVELREIRGLLVPAMAFDTYCNRLGRGKGFYDRALADIQNQNSKIIKIGIALDRQIWEGRMNVDPLDIPMHWVITESRHWASDDERDLQLADILSERNSS